MLRIIKPIKEYKFDSNDFYAAIKHTSYPSQIIEISERYFNEEWGHGWESRTICEILPDKIEFRNCILRNELFIDIIEIYNNFNNYYTDLGGIIYQESTDTKCKVK